MGFSLRLRAATLRAARPRLLHRRNACLRPFRQA